MAGAVAPGAPPDRGPRIVVHGNVRGSIQVGDNNIAVNDNHGSIVLNRVEPIRRRRPAAPPPRPPLPFVGRATELDRLRTAIVSRAAVTLSGEAGAGRTALARAVASQSADDLADGVLRVDGVDRAGTALSGDEIAQRLYDAAWDAEPRPRVTLDTARGELGAIEALAIVDEVSLPGRVLERIADLLPRGSVVITTGPAGPDGDLEDVAVGGLDRSESIALLTARAGLPAGDGLPIDPPTGIDLDAICTLLADWPGALAVAGRAMRARELDPATARAEIGAIEPAGGSVRGAAMERAYGLARPALDPNARRMLSTAAALPGATIDPDVLRRVLGDPPWFDEAAATLTGLDLMSLNSPRFRFAAGIREIAGRSGEIDAEEVADRHLEVAVALATERALDAAYVIDDLGGLLGAFDRAIRRGQWVEAIRVGRAIDPQLVLHGLWDVHATVVRGVLAAAERIGAAAVVGWATHELGTLELALGHRAAARSLLEDALARRLRLGDDEGAAYTRHNLDRLVPPPGWLARLRRNLPIAGVALVAVLGLVIGGPIITDAVGCLVGGCPAPSPTATATLPPIGPSVERLAIDARDPEYVVDGRVWRGTLVVAARGGVAPYRFVIDGVGEASDNPASFVITGIGCEARRVTGDVRSADGQRVPLDVTLLPRDCAATPEPPTVACVDFDSLDSGTTYGAETGEKPGDEILATESGIRVSVREFRYVGGGRTFNFATIGEAVDEFGSGRIVVFNNLNFAFDFADVGFRPSRVELVFRDQGGSEDLAVNGSDIAAADIVDMPRSILGVRVTVEADPEHTTTGRLILEGPVEQFLIGGQEFSIDDICAYR